jgi:hypothetical protein
VAYQVLAILLQKPLNVGRQCHHFFFAHNDHGHRRLRSEAPALDGCYVIKSDVPQNKADKATLQARYKDLASVERDFRDMKTAHLEVRPVYVRKKERTKGHVFVVMLALLLKRHMEKLLTASYGEGRPAVSEVLRSLDRLCCQERDIEGIPVRYIPIPDERQSGYLAALGVPKKLVSLKGAHVR